MNKLEKVIEEARAAREAAEAAKAERLAEFKARDDAARAAVKDAEAAEAKQTKQRRDEFIARRSAELKERYLRVYVESGGTPDGFETAWPHILEGLTVANAQATQRPAVTL